MKEHHRRLARYLHSAWTAYHMGISLAYADKTYGTDDPGEFWFDLAEFVDGRWTESVNKLMPTPQGKPQ